MTTDSPPESVTVLTRDQPGNRLWKTALERRGLVIYDLPCIETASVPLSADSRQLLSHLPDYEWLIFTSAAGVRFFAGLVTASSLDRHTLAQLKIAAVGRSTADSITALGLVVSFTPSQADVTTLTSQLPGVKNHQVLFVQAAVTDPEARAKLEKRGAHVDVLPVYQTKLLTKPDPIYSSLLAAGGVERVIFASPSAVTAYWARLTSVEHRLATNVPAIAIGKATSRALTDLRFATITIAKTPSVEAILDLI